MQNDKDEKFLLSLILSSTFLIIGLLLGAAIEKNTLQKEAVKAGVARYASDENGASKFEWAVPMEKKQ